METQVIDAPAESSPALEVPRDGAAYAEWRATGKLPEAAPVAKETPAEGDKPEGKTAPASETGKGTQEKKRSGADARLNELLDDLRRAGLTPAELKTFKREAQKTEQQTAEAAKPPEQTEKPAELKAPVKPKIDDYKTFDEYDAAKDKYFEELADYKAAKKLEEHQQKLAQDAANQTVHQKMQEAKTRYGDEAIGIISATARAITSDQQIPQAVQAILNDSPVWTDVLYTLGSKPEELAGFVNLAKTNPGEAIRKAVLIEQLVKDELSKGTTKTDATETPRGEDGKFTKTTPEKKESNAPPPPREVSGRGTTPPDQVESAVKNGDFRSFRNAQNEKDLARRRR